MAAEYIDETARQVPIVSETDVLVCGAGPAGVSAALAAARAGARVGLIEVQGCLGGVWTAGMLSVVLDTGNKGGIMRELLAALDQQRGRESGSPRYDPETMKIILEQRCVDAGVKIRLHTRVVTARRDGRRLSEVVTESKSGREAWRARVFIDATGDGDLAAHAGCGFDFGRPETGRTQPMSLMGLLVGIRFEDVERFVPGSRFGSREPKATFLAELNRAGVAPSYSRPSLFHIRENLFALMANHEYGFSAIDADAVSQATLRARAEVHAMVDALRGLGGIWSAVRLAATASHIGVREGRRIHGRYTVTARDVAEGARFDDAVCRATFPVDIHSTNPAESKGYDTEGITARPYDIPLRSLIAKDVDDLLLAGRCISGDFIAHASYRVTGNAVTLGEAAGITAALAAGRHCAPHEVPWPAIQELLKECGAVTGD